MLVPDRSPKVLLRALLGLPAILALSIPLLLTACGGSGTPPPTPSSAKQWMWISGSNVASASGVYGTMGIAAANNIPGARDLAVSWRDSIGNLWLFGGEGYDSTGTQGDLNDLWEFNPTTKEWTWMSGSSTNTVSPNCGLFGVCGQSGVYGTMGTPNASNVPGGRYGSVSWTDTSGNLWLFGGDGLDSTDTFGNLNDLWEFNPSSKQWTWMSGSSTVGSAYGGQSGVYGTLGTASASNVPGGREASSSWIDSSGNLWLFGGFGMDSTGTNVSSFLNDLWEFNPVTKEWTWMSGSSTLSARGIYGTKGTAAASNVPGSREASVSWMDGSGNLCLFGGVGRYSTGTVGDLNDLWEFNPTTKMWTWMSGSSNSAATDAPGVYGTQGSPSTSNVPGGRSGSVSWIDSSGNLWLFGGYGADSTGTNGQLNDLWSFNLTTKEWTWMSGSDTVPSANQGQPGVYGTKGTPAASNVPGGRWSSVSWIDSSGNLWLFGGYGADSTGAQGYLNDLWRYQP